MTMVPSQNGKQTSNYVFYSNTTTSAMNQVEVEGSYNYLLGSDFLLRHMAEEESSSRATNNTSTTHHHHSQNQNQNQPEAEAEEAEAGSTSKEEEERGGANNNNNSNWLQLSIGFHQSHTAVPTTKHNPDHHHHHYHHRDRAGSVPAQTSDSGLVELDLLPPTGRHSSRTGLETPQPAIYPVAAARGCQLGGSSAFGSSLLFEQMTTTLLSSSLSSSMSMSMPSGPTFGHHQPHQEMMNLAFGPLLPHHSMAFMPSSSSFIPSYSSSSSSCSSLRPSLGSYYPSPLIHHHFPSSSSPFPSGFDQLDVVGPSSDVTVRVVDPPRRPHSGIWFMLQASQNQTKEPFLPQIPKNYLRIKDGRMTVRLLLKYLVSKLRLESESEIEITCRGQQLLPFLTLQHVRDNIWTQRDTTRPLLSDSSTTTTDHVMVLHYARATA